MLEIGSVVGGKYKILNQIGKGGMSIVYLAMNEKANKQWAIKEFRRDRQHDFEMVRQGLLVEMNMLKKLKHERLPSIVDVIDENEYFLIVMDYIEGITLSRALEEQGAQPQEKVMEWAKQLCGVLEYLHTQNPPIIYRDMKPANIMLKPDGSVMLIDFGTAREYKTGNVEDTTYLGTQGYAAPEQFGGCGQTDARTDIYCLGTTLYHLLTGHNPCEPPYEMYPIRQWDSSLSSGLEYIITRCTQRNPDDRYSNCQELLHDLEHYNELNMENQKRQRRRMRVTILCAVLSMICFVGSFVTYRLDKKTVGDGYEAAIVAANISTSADERIAYYQKAIHIDPKNEKAYMEVLNHVFLEDGNFDKKEEKRMRELLLEASDGVHANESLFHDNKGGYEEFAYQMGLAYFYCYQDDGDKSLSSKWFSVAANSQHLSKERAERAARLGRIASYYNRIGKVSKSGDEAVGYIDYWKDLKELSVGNIVEEDNEVTSLMMYKELIYQIYTNTERFREDGVPKEELMLQLRNVGTRLDNDFQEKGTVNDEQMHFMLHQVKEDLGLAEKTVESTYAD